MKMDLLALLVVGGIYLSPDSVLYTRNVTFKFTDYVPNSMSTWQETYNNNPGVDYQLLKTNQFFISPTMKYRVNEGFRLILNDFYGFTAQEEKRELIASLTGLKLIIYNNDTGQELLSDFNILSYKDVQQLEDGQYYIDIDFKDVMPFMNTIDAEYTVFIISNLQVSSISSYTENYPSHLREVITNYQSLDYFRYIYRGGSGILIETDKDGNIINPDDPDPTPTPDAMQEAINDQTDAIKENTEVNKNIFQEILELPSKIIELLLDALKSLFIPRDGFFNDWLDDLNHYFGDAFGILYYPFELLIDFLNRVGRIDETSTAIINVPRFDIDFLGYQATLFQGYTFDFNSILVNETYKNIHIIYLTVVDIILWLSVVYLAAKCIHSIIRRNHRHYS